MHTGLKDSRHVYREHVTTGLDCWCAPTYLLPCDECETGCWKCENGTTALTRTEAGAVDRPIVIVHNGGADA